MSEASFRETTLPRLGNRVLRLGVAGNYGLRSADVLHAAEHGVNVWLWGASFRKVTAGLKELLARERERHVIVAISTVAFSARGVRKSVDRARRALGVDHLDVFLLGWLGRTARFSLAMQDTLVELREAGVVRAVGCSIHDRVRAGALARESVLDALMIRYSAKHPGAEQDIFPHLGARQPLIISYTTTAWRQLLKPIKGLEMPPWPGETPPGATPPPLPPEICYRFVLSSPHVHVTWTGPRNRAQLDQNLALLDQGPLPPEEDAWVRQYGRKVHARKRLPFV